MDLAMPTIEEALCGSLEEEEFVTLSDAGTPSTEVRSLLSEQSNTDSQTPEKLGMLRQSNTDFPTPEKLEHAHESVSVAAVHSHVIDWTSTTRCKTNHVIEEAAATFKFIMDSTLLQRESRIESSLMDITASSDTSLMERITSTCSMGVSCADMRHDKLMAERQHASSVQHKHYSRVAKLVRKEQEKALARCK
jgi:hypothetical protein